MTEEEQEWAAEAIEQAKRDHKTILALREQLDRARTERDDMIATCAAGAAEIAKSRQEEREYRAEIAALKAELKRYTAVYGDPDAPVDVSSFAVGKPDAPLTGSFPWGRDKIDALLRDHAPSLAWTVTGDAGERVYRATWGAYSARIVEGRVWRWQVGTDASPDLYGGRIVGTLDDAQAACFHALSLCLLGEKSDVPHGTSVNFHPFAEAPHVKVGDHVRCESLGNLTGIVARVTSTQSGGAGCIVRDDEMGHEWFAMADLLEVLP